MHVLILILMLNAGNMKNIDFMIFDNKSINVYEISYLSDNEINKRLKGTFLEGCGNIMYMIEREKKINFRAVYAIAALESGKGEDCISKNNYCGIKNEENTGYREFDSRDECLIYLSNLLNAEIYRNKSLDDIGKIYCPPDPTWANQVKEIMGEI
ncbi:MAG: glucosaminidase domain-containing protein [Peptoanaerobacter stomatis]|uniref:glucosaminidase domain-containing protein n=1 Tax=Peptoanaerobacter stomatis TaxID=796937 RepID=UPI003FA05392